MRNLLTVAVKPGDIFFTTGGSLLSRAILWGQREKGEARSRVNHVGAFVERGGLKTANGVEALWRVKCHPIYPRYKGQHVAIFRPRNITVYDEYKIVSYLKQHVGNRYGWWKLLLQLAGHKLGWNWARNAMFIDDRPICSYLVAKAYREAGLDFGVQAQAAAPDDMWDFIENNPDKYKVVLPLQRLP